MTAAIRQASWWTHARFAVVVGLEKSGLSRVNLCRDESADFLGEIKQWLNITSTTHEWPWQWVLHVVVALRADIRCLLRRMVRRSQYDIWPFSSQECKFPQ